MGDLERLFTTVAYLVVLVFVVTAALTPPDPVSQVVLAGPLLAVGLVASVWLVYFDGWRRVPVTVPTPAAYFLEAFGAAVGAGLVSILVPQRPLDIVVVTSTTRGVVAAAIFLSAVTWLYAFGGHERLVAAGYRVRKRTRA